MKDKKGTSTYIARSAIIAVIYFVLCMVFSPLAFGAVQARVAEGMNVLLFYCPEAVLGLTLGCFLTNLSSPFLFYDLILGTFATFVSCLIGRRIKNKWFVGAPAILINAFVVGYVLEKTSNVPFWAGCVSVGAGQFISVYGVGTLLVFAIEKNPRLKALLGKKTEDR